MAVRIKWDEYETALLIDTFWKIETEPENKKLFIEELSTNLRQRAVNKGIEIDDIFRNVNGIGMQLSPIAHAFFPERPSLTTSAMFEKMVELYKDDRPAFDEILNTAKRQIGGSAQMNDDADNRVAFAAWLSSNCPKGLSSQDIIRSLDEGSYRSIKSKYSNKSFWEISSIEEFSGASERVLESLRWGRLWFSRKKEFTLLKRSSELYRQYLSEKDKSQKVESPSFIERDEKKHLFPSIDRTEAIYLIDTYLETIAQKGNWDTIATDVSRIFRSRALQFDELIDEAYRNVLFVEACYSDIAILFQNPNSEDCHPLLAELVNLYIKDPDRYGLQSKIVHEELHRLGVIIPARSNSTDNKESQVDAHCVSKQDQPIIPEEISELHNGAKVAATVEDNAEDMQQIIVPTPSMEDSTYLPDKVYLILKTESARNKYGTTLYYLSSLANAPQEEVKSILERSEWAQYQYGKYFFVELGSGEAQYNFAKPSSLAYTRPVRLIYFEEAISEATTWRQLYLDFMRALYEDYPDIIKSIVGNVYSPSSTSIVNNVTEFKEYRVPGEFVPGLVIELSQSASSIVNCIAQLLDLCNVDNENVRIFYERKRTPALEKSVNEPVIKSGVGVVLPQRQVVEKPERHYSRDDKEAFYRWLKEDQSLAEATCRGYVSAIRGAEDYASSYISSSCKLFCDDKDIIAATVHELFVDKLFKKKNEQQHNRFFAALRKYLEYMHVALNVGNEPAQERDEQIPQIVPEINEKILATMKEHFVYGFNTSSPIEMMRFRAQYETDHQTPCDLNDKALYEAITNCGLSYNGKVYVVSQNCKDRISELFQSRIDAGEIIFYYEEVYLANEDWLYDEHIVDSEMLKTLVESIFPRYQHKERFLLAYNGRITELSALKKAILNAWGEQVLRTFTELRELLPYIPLDKIRYALSYGKEFTWNSLETYARNDLFVVSNEQIEEIIRFVDEKCSENGSVTFDELPLEDLAAENFELSESALYEMVFSYLPETYSKNGKVISQANSQQLDTIAAIQQYCRKRETCTLVELQQVMQDTEGTIRYPVVIEAANAVMVRVSQDDFVTDDNVQFDVPGIDSALDSFVHGNGIGLKEVTTFGTFPFCGYAWNLFVLESYCRRFSEKYKYECMTPNSNNAGAIIRKSSDLSYHDIMVEALARSDVKLVENDAFDYLISTGFLIRRRYNGMDSLLKKAMELREGGD